MAGTTQATVAVATPAFAKRKARALIGWLPEQEGALWISGRQMQLVPDPAHIGLCQSARALVAARPVGLDQTGFAVDVPTVLHDHIGNIRAHPWSAQALLDAGEPRLVDLRKIRAVQPVIHVEDPIKRVERPSQTQITRITIDIWNGSAVHLIQSDLIWTRRTWHSVKLKSDRQYGRHRTLTNRVTMAHHGNLPKRTKRVNLR